MIGFNFKSLCLCLTLILGFSTLSNAQWQNTENFEQSLGIWNDGGSDALRLKQTNLVNGEYCVRLRDNSNAASSIFTDNLDLSGYNVVFVSFHYVPLSMEANEDFFLEYSSNGGANFETIKTYIVGRDFNNGDRKNDQVTINRNFTNSSVFRFRCDASGNSDFVYIDDVTISTSSVGGGGACSVTATTSNLQCFGNGTTSIDDDTFTIDVTVTGSNTSGRWTGGINGQNRNGNIGQAVTFGPFRTNHGSTVSGWFRDESDSNCQMDITVTAPRGCSDVAPDPTPTAGCNGRITGFSINPQNASLFGLARDARFCTDRFTSRDIRIRANVSGTHQSMRFVIETPDGTWTTNENAETYDSKGFWATSAGTYRITATLYSEDGQRGEMCDTRTETFVVEACNVAPTFDCTNLNANIGDSCNDGNNATSGDTVNSNCQCVGSCNTKSIRVRNTGPCDISLFDWRSNQDVFITNINAGSERTVNAVEGQRFRAIDTGRDFNNLAFDQEFTAGAACNQTITINTDYCNQQPAGCNGRITGFSINPQNASLFGLARDARFCTDRFTSRDIRIRANVSGTHQSMRFVIETPDGTWTTNENAETYDSKGFWATSAGTYRITATLYSEDGQRGEMCDTRTETFVVEACNVAPTFDCTNLNANIGDSCNDGNNATSGDTVNSNCQCVGSCNTKSIRVRNTGPCDISLFDWRSNQDVFITNINAGSERTVNAVEGQRFRAIDTGRDFNNLAFDQEFTAGAACNQTITINTDYCNQQPAGCNGRITGFSINPQNAALINNVNGQEFCADQFTARDIRIRANVSGTHQSMRFTITTPDGSWTTNENAETYDSRGFWATTPGTYTISAVLYSEDGQRGDQCDTRTETFTIRDCNTGGGGNPQNGACSIVVATSNIQCSGNGTSSIHDDTFTVDVVVTGSNTSARWVGGIGGQDRTGSYGQRVTFGPFPTNSGSTISGWFTDENDSNCLHDITVTPPRGCSDNIPTGGNACNFQLVSYEGFENGYDTWNDGGSDCFRIEEDAAAAGRYCVRLRDNSGAASSTISDQLRFNGVQEVKVEFIFFANSMEIGEDLILEYTTDGSNFKQVRSWVAGTDFQNNRFENVNVTFGGNFTDNTKLRIRCDASSNYDIVYVDEIRVSACGGSYLNGNNTQRSAKSSIILPKAEKVDVAEEITEISVYPNPASHTLNIKGLNGQSYDVFNITGQRVVESSNKEVLDLMTLQNGTYILRTQNGQMIRFNKI